MEEKLCKACLYFDIFDNQIDGVCTSEGWVEDLHNPLRMVGTDATCKSWESYEESLIANKSW